MTAGIWLIAVGTFSALVGASAILTAATRPLTGGDASWWPLGPALVAVGIAAAWIGERRRSLEAAARAGPSPRNIVVFADQQIPGRRQ